METEEIVRSLTRDLTPVRQLPAPEARARRWAWFAVASVVTGTVLLGPRHDLLSRLRDPHFVFQNVLVVLLFLASGRLAFELSVPGAPRSVVSRAVAFAGLLTWALLLTTGPVSSTGAAAGWRCVFRMVSLALVPSAAAFAMLRRAAPLRPGWTSYLAVLAAASIATSGMQVICPKEDPAHVLYWHFVPLFVWALAAGRLGRSLLTRRLLRHSSGLLMTMRSIGR